MKSASTQAGDGVRMGSAHGHGIRAQVLVREGRRLPASGLDLRGDHRQRAQAPTNPSDRRANFYVSSLRSMNGSKMLVFWYFGVISFFLNGSYFVCLSVSLLVYLL